jgi:cellulose synthase/poly-beta-1,6-N-acetylglucosamine synthase-like glycosyltransferase
LDAGTEPEPSALVYLIDAMELDECVSGCCGEIIIEDTSNLILKAQWLEFRLAHSLQKSFESFCGFIPVLPGAFSAYRWRALSANKNQVINEYLKPFKNPSLNWIDTNIYFLAEDRVKMEIIVKLPTSSSMRKNTGHILKFIKEAKAKTEGKEDIFELMKQRRRWNNGAWFCMIKSLFRKCNTIEICRTKHTLIRKFILILQIWYYFLVVTFQWFSIGAYYLAFSMALNVRSI